MLINRATALAVATLSALFAGGGVLALAKPSASAAQPIPRSADGHFWATGTASSDVGRADIHFLVDTGASTVALTATDAARLGFKPDQLIYSRPVFTAEGEVRAAPVTLSRVAVGGAVVREVRALVLQDGPRKNGPRTSLLGMSYLGRLSRMTATRKSLLLEP
jgi:aspartyl protease family protein